MMQLRGTQVPPRAISQPRQTAAAFALPGRFAATHCTPWRRRPAGSGQAIQQQQVTADSPPPPPPPGSAGSTHPLGGDAGDEHSDNQRKVYRKLLSGVEDVALAVGVVGVIFGGFVCALTWGLKPVFASIEELDTSLTTLMNRQFDEVNRQFDVVNGKIDKLGRRVITGHLVTIIVGLAVAYVKK